MSESFETAQQTAIVPLRTMPHSDEAEEYLLSCCFIDGTDVVTRCMEARIKSDSFYDPRRGVIFECISDLHGRQQPIDVAIIAEELTTKRRIEDAGGIPYLTHVSSRMSTTAQANYFIAKVRELALLRDINRCVTGIAEDTYNYSGGLEDFVDGVERKLLNVTQRRVSDGTKDTRQLVNTTLRAMTNMMHNKGEITGVPSGFVDLDRLTWGFQPSDLIILAARPSMGKTSLAMNIAENIATTPPEKRKGAVLIFSLEMGAAQLMQRMIASRARVNMKLIRDGLLSKNGTEQMSMISAAAEIAEAPIIIDDTSSASVLYIRAKARRIHQRTPLAFVIVDYLQLVESGNRGASREQQVAEVSRGMKGLAKDLNVPVLVLSQLSRKAETEKRPPNLSDLRESGSIEQDADVVVFLARPRDSDEKFQVAADSSDVIIAKQRNGPVGELKLTFSRDITRFSNYHE